MKRIYLDGMKSNYFVDKSGNVYNSKKKLMKPYMINSGYLAVKLSHQDVKYHRSIHRLVAEAYIGEIPKGYVVNHKDGVKTNNCIENLEIVSYSDNVNHAINNGLLGVGECCYRSKYTNEQIHLVCRLLSEGNYSFAAISNITGVSKMRVIQIHKRYKWKSISKYYTFPDKLPRSKNYEEGKLTLRI